MLPTNHDTIDIDLEQPKQMANETLINLLNSQFANKDRGELRTELEKFSDKVWTNEELLEDFEVEQFLPPYVVVIRKQDGVRGTVAFVDSPRLYFYFCATDNHEARNEKTV